MKVVPIAYDVICEGCNRTAFDLHALNICVNNDNIPACKTCNTDLSYTLRLFPVLKKDRTSAEINTLALHKNIRKLFASPTCRVIEIEDDKNRMIRVDFY